MAELIYVKFTKYKNICNACGIAIPSGSVSWWNKQEKLNYHELCKPIDATSEQVQNAMNSLGKAGAPSSRTSASPAKTTTKADKSLDNSDEALIEIEDRVAKRLAKAYKIVDDENPAAKSFTDYIYLVAEVFHQLYGEETSIRIQANKENNMKGLR